MQHKYLYKLFVYLKATVPQSSLSKNRIHTCFRKNSAPPPPHPPPPTMATNLLDRPYGGVVQAGLLVDPSLDN